MTRWTFRILLCLLLGVVTTVGVAWGLTVLAPLGVNNRWMTEASENRADGVVWIAHTHSRRGRLFVFSVRGDRGLDYVETSTPTPAEIVPRWTGFHIPEPPNVNYRGYDFDTRITESAGWPRLAMRCDYLPHDSPYSTQTTLVSGIRISGTHTVERAAYSNALPVRLIVYGFLINTLFYAAIWLALLFGLTATRRTIRRRRGRCPKCGYDLRADFDNGCSECGWGREQEGNLESAT